MFPFCFIRGLRVHGFREIVNKKLTTINKKLETIARGENGVRAMQWKLVDGNSKLG